MREYELHMYILCVLTCIFTVKRQYENVLIIFAACVALNVRSIEAFGASITYVICINIFLHIPVVPSVLLSTNLALALARSINTKHHMSHNYKGLSTYALWER